MREIYCPDCGKPFGSNEAMFKLHMQFEHNKNVFEIDTEGKEYKSFNIGIEKALPMKNMKQIYRYNFIGYKLENRQMKKIEESVVHEALDPMLGIASAKGMIEKLYDIPMCDIHIPTIEDTVTGQVFEHESYTVYPIVQNEESQTD